MTEKSKIEYECLITKVTSTGALWFCTQTQEWYLAVDSKKIQPMTKRGYRLLKGMVRKEFFDRYALEPMFE